MSNYQKYTDEELKPWIDGTNCHIGSAAYTQALQEVNIRKNAKDKQQIEEWLQSLVKTINSLKENWKTKVFWLIIVAIAVSIFSEVVGAWIISLLNIK